VNFAELYSPPKVCQEFFYERSEKLTTKHEKHSYYKPRDFRNGQDKNHVNPALPSSLRKDWINPSDIPPVAGVPLILSKGHR
jgi:hypothetical protein